MTRTDRIVRWMVSRRRGAAAALFACATCALAPGWASAQEALPVAVVSIQTEDVLDQADALTTALKQALRRTPGWSLQEGEWALEVLTVSLECAEPPDAACETKMADQLKAERLLWGTLKKKNASTVDAELHLWTRGKGSQVATISYSANLTEANDESLGQVAKDALTQLTGGTPNGKVRLRVGTLNGQVLQDGKPVGTLSGGLATVSLPPGRHVLVVRSEGVADMETTVEVKPLGTVDVTLTPPPPEKGIDIQKVLGFGTIGLGLGFAAVGVVSSLRIQGLNEDLDPAREFVGADQDVCDVAAGDVRDPAFDATRVTEICDEAGTFETLQMIMYPLAAVSIGTGIVLLSTADWSGEPETGAASRRPREAKRELLLEPRVGLGRGNLRLTYTF
jgi:hypothetical protein